MLVSGTAGLLDLFRQPPCRPIALHAEGACDNKGILRGRYIQNALVPQRAGPVLGEGAPIGPGWTDFVHSTIARDRPAV
jgi:hypothetical protein